MTRPDESPTPRWWAEKQLWLVLAVLVVALFPRLEAIPFRGEEHRRIQVAEEMAHHGDWVVPRQQGEVYVSRPPGQQWMIAATEWAFGRGDRWAARFPSAVAVTLTSLLLYGYSRQFVGRAGATVAALAYPTTGEVLGQAQQAETESVFAFLLSAALLLWHWGYTRRWPAGLTWAAGYGFAAAAALCKAGLQPPVYLLGPIGAFLLWKRDLRFALSRGHLIGLAVGAAVVAAWAAPCAERVGWDATRKIWMSNTESRMVAWKAGAVLAHLARFPGEALACLLPWGLLLPAALVPAVRRAVAGCPAVPFCVAAVLVAYPTVWLPPGGVPRYLVPVYPCLAVLAGVLADRAAAGAAGAVWRWYMTASAVTLVGVGAAFVAGAWLFPGTELEVMALPPGRAAVYAAVLVGLAVVAAKLRGAATPAGVIAGAFVVAAGCAVVATGPVVDCRAVWTNDIAAAVAPVRDRLPADAVVVGVGHVHASVRYHLGRVVPRTPEVPPGAYFCVNVRSGVRPELPFAWEEVATVPTDRYLRSPTGGGVLVGRRLADPAR